MSGGRPTDLTPEMSKALCDLVRAGLPLSRAAEHEGISYQTMCKWRNRKEPLYVAFSDSLKNAKAASQKQSIDKIRAGTPGWQGEAWYLERSDPKNWGRRLEVKQEPKPKEPIKPEDDPKTVREKLLSALAEVDQQITAKEAHESTTH